MFQKTRAVAQKYGAQIASIPAAALVLAGNAFAEVPTEVSTELTSLKTDALIVAGAVLAAVVAVYAFKFMRKGL